MRRRFFIGRAASEGDSWGEREGSDSAEHCLRLSVVVQRLAVSGLRGRSGQCGPLRAVADNAPVSYPTHRSSPAGVGPVVELLFSGGFPTALVARFRFSAEKSASNICPRFFSGSGGLLHSPVPESRCGSASSMWNTLQDFGVVG